MPRLHRTPRVRPLSLAVNAALALVAATPAAAQVVASEAARATQMVPITVTAERRAEDIKDVPNSVSVVGGEMLEILNSSGQDVRLLAGRVPSLNIESSFGRAFPRF